MSFLSEIKYLVFCTMYVLFIFSDNDNMNSDVSAMSSSSSRIMSTSQLSRCPIFLCYVLHQSQSECVHLHVISHQSC